MCTNTRNININSYYSDLGFLACEGPSLEARALNSRLEAQAPEGEGEGSVMPFPT